MDGNKKIMPERFYSLDNNMSLDKILLAKTTNEPLVGRIVLWDAETNCLKVNLGNEFYGVLPIDLATVYQALKPNGELSHSIQAKIGSIVTVNVLSVSFEVKGNLKITLSRKMNMLSAFDSISNSIGKVVECCVTNLSPYGIFVDVGYGIDGLIPFKNLCSSQIYSLSILGIELYKKINAKIEYVDSNFHVCLNYKSQFENLSFKLKHNDLIEVTLLQPINFLGYLAYINPNTPAIVDVPMNIKCSYGDKIIARVKGTRKNHPEQLKLSFISFA